MTSWAGSLRRDAPSEPHKASQSINTEEKAIKKAQRDKNKQFAHTYMISHTS